MGLGIYFFYHRYISLRNGSPLVWFIMYMGSFSIISYLGSFGGIGLLKFPFDLICFLPYSILILYMSQVLATPRHDNDMIGNVTELPVYNS